VVRAALGDRQEIVVVIAEHRTAREQSDIVERSKRLDRLPNPLGRWQTANALLRAQ